MARIPVTEKHGGSALATADVLLDAIRKHTDGAADMSETNNIRRYEAETAAKLGEALDAVTRYIVAIGGATPPRNAE